MIKLLEDVLDRVKSWPRERQEDAARVLEAMEIAGADVYRLCDGERALVQAGLEEAERGNFASANEVEAFWTRNRK